MRITLPLAAAAFALSGLAVVPSASATQATPDGCGVQQPSPYVDYDAYIAFRKAQFARQLAADPSLF